MVDYSIGRADIALPEVLIKANVTGAGRSRDLSSRVVAYNGACCRDPVAPQAGHAFSTMSCVRPER